VSDTHVEMHPSLIGPSVPAFHTSTEVALRLNKLQEDLEAYAAGMAALQVQFKMQVEQFGALMAVVEHLSEQVDRLKRSG
jgi:hypothetical protein